jgi:hypothetical protein
MSSGVAWSRAIVSRPVQGQIGSKRFWNIVARAGGCESKAQALAARLWFVWESGRLVFRDGIPKNRPYRFISRVMDGMGFVNEGTGHPYHPDTLRERIVPEALARKLLFTFDAARLDAEHVATVAKAVRIVMRRKQPYRHLDPTMREWWIEQLNWRRSCPKKSQRRFQDDSE